MIDTTLVCNRNPAVAQLQYPLVFKFACIINFKYTCGRRKTGAAAALNLTDGI